LNEPKSYTTPATPSVDRDRFSGDLTFDESVKEVVPQSWRQIRPLNFGH